MLKACPTCGTAHHINALACCQCAHKFRTKFPPEPTQLLLPELAPITGKVKRKPSLASIFVCSFLVTTLGLIVLSYTLFPP